jgi:predicted permease
MLESLRHDLKHALRGLARDRAFTGVAVLSVALGVGANAAIFSLVDQALYRRLPVREPERLVLLSWNGRFVGSGWGSGNLLPHPMFRELKAQGTVFEGVFARHPTTVHLTVDGTPEPATADVVSGSYFDVLGVRPALGRLLGESDDLSPDAHPVVVLAYDYWKNRLGAPADVVGRRLLVNNHPMTVIGVSAAGFRGVDFGEVPQLFVPLMMARQALPDFDWLDNRRGRFLHIFGRLKPGTSQQAAAARLQPWFKAMLDADMKHSSWPVVSAEERDRFLASSLDVLPGATGRSDLRRRLEQPLYVLLAATGLVLLLACLNVANLSLARAFAHRRDTALRLAIGASRGRVVRERLVESAILAGLGALVGTLLAPLVTNALVAFLPEAVDLSTSVNPRVFGVALALALAAGILAGLLPALHASRTPPGSGLREDSRSVASGLGLRRALVVGQVALALVLLVGAGLFVRTLHNLRARGPGFETSNLLMFHVDPARAGYDAPRARALVQQIVAAVRALPEVRSAAVATASLLGPGSWSTRFTVDGDRRFVAEDVVHCNAIGPGFFETLGAAIVEGRSFDDRDTARDPDPGTPVDDDRVFRSAIVNERFAGRYFGGRSPIGARMAFGAAPNVVTTIEIVGVVRSFSYRARGLREVEEQAFFPYFEGTLRGGVVYARTRAASAAAFASIRAAVGRLDPTLPLDDLRTLDDQLDRALANERLLALLASAFGLLAVLLAVVGLYGVTAFVVARRTREIGIRMALGATSGAALRLVVRDAAAMVALGVLVALPVVWGLGRLLSSQLFGVAATDAATFAAATSLVTGAALAAAALPARRAARVSPLEALRVE